MRLARRSHSNTTAVANLPQRLIGRASRRVRVRAASSGVHCTPPTVPTCTRITHGCQDDAAERQPHHIVPTQTRCPCCVTAAVTVYTRHTGGSNPTGSAPHHSIPPASFFPLSLLSSPRCSDSDSTDSGGGRAVGGRWWRRAWRRVRAIADQPLGRAPSPDPPSCKMHAKKKAYVCRPVGVDALCGPTSWGAGRSCGRSGPLPSVPLLLLASSPRRRRSGPGTGRRRPTGAVAGCGSQWCGWVRDACRAIFVHSPLSSRPPFTSPHLVPSV